MKHTCFYVNPCLARIGPDQFTMFHAGLYHGWEIEDADPKPQFAVNVRTGPLWMPEIYLLMTPEVWSELRTHTSAEAAPARIAYAFDRKIDRGDGLENYFGERVIYGVAGDHLLPYLKARRCEVPAPELLHVQPKIVYRLENEYDDLVTISPNGDTINTHFPFSRKMVHDYGIISSHGFVCTAAAFRVIERYVRNIFFDVVEL